MTSTSSMWYCCSGVRRGTVSSKIASGALMWRGGRGKGGRLLSISAKKIKLWKLKHVLKNPQGVVGYGEGQRCALGWRRQRQHGLVVPEGRARGLDRLCLTGLRMWAAQSHLQPRRRHAAVGQQGQVGCTVDHDLGTHGRAGGRMTAGAVALRRNPWLLMRASTWYSMHIKGRNAPRVGRRCRLSRRLTGLLFYS